MRLTAQDAVLVGDAELDRGMRAAWAVSVPLVALALLLGFLAWALANWLIGGAAIFVVLVMVGLAIGLIMHGHAKGQGQVEKVIKHNISVYTPETPMFIDGETLPELPANVPATLPALSVENETFRFTQNGVGQDVPKNLLHGFDARDLAFLARYLARGGKFTESVMEFLELPYSREVMGKAEDGTLYTKFMQLCVDTEVIVGRGPKKSGTLVVLEAGEMLARFKALA